MSKKDGSSKFFLLAISTALATSELLAATDMPAQSKKKMEPTEFTSQPKNMITPPVAPSVNNGADFFVSTSFIYWNLNICDGNSQYAATGASGTIITQGSQHRTTSQWEPGFKVGAGFEFAHDGWDVYAEWTWLNPVHQKSVTTNSPGNIADGIILQPTFGSLTAAGVDVASNTLTTHFNEINLELGRNFFVSKYMTIRPNMGLKGLWYQDNIKRTAHSTIARVAPAAQWEFLTIKEKTTGVGLRMGTDAVWHFMKNWGIYGNMNFSALASWNKTKTLDVLNVEALDDQTIASDFKRHLFTVLPVMEIGAGFEYMTWLCDESYMINIKAGWEDQFAIPIQQSSIRLGELSLQGLTFEAGFHF